LRIRFFIRNCNFIVIPLNTQNIVACTKQLVTRMTVRDLGDLYEWALDRKWPMQCRNYKTNHGGAKIFY